LRRLTGGPELRLRVGDWRVRLELDSGKSVATISVASDRRDRQAPALFVDLVVWERRPRPPPSTSSRARP
jgi:hypothetical protein